MVTKKKKDPSGSPESDITKAQKAAYGGYSSPVEQAAAAAKETEQTAEKAFGGFKSPVEQAAAAAKETEQTAEKAYGGFKDPVEQAANDAYGGYPGPVEQAAAAARGEPTDIRKKPSITSKTRGILGRKSGANIDYTKKKRERIEALVRKNRADRIKRATQVASELTQKQQDLADWAEAEAEDLRTNPEVVSNDGEEPFTAVVPPELKKVAPNLPKMATPVLPAKLPVTKPPVTPKVTPTDTQPITLSTVSDTPIKTTSGNPKGVPQKSPNLPRMADLPSRGLDPKLEAQKKLQLAEAQKQIRGDTTGLSPAEIQQKAAAQKQLELDVYNGCDCLPDIPKAKTKEEQIQEKRAKYEKQSAPTERKILVRDEKKIPERAAPPKRAEPPERPTPARCAC